ncbi:MAG: aminotransferase class V-fold PLP-dependent enzyme [Caldithrix sp.]|nr:MAG: aminotransferase class V-fold PLP-dependent enzyme [Caldithrix sp.]TDI95878.1 MAG: aminotransferase class V-fold PLP-dependent enzyme [Caldithrix sp.]
MIANNHSLEDYFKKFRENVIGYNQTFETPFGRKRIVYADWTASGRLYRPIENKLMNEFGPFVGNTHTETTVTGTSMTKAYHRAHKIIKKHVKAGPDDVILTTGSGMTRAVTKFQRILGLKVPEQLMGQLNIPEELRPIVFVTHMEHHSNHTSWLETIADVECILPDEDGLIDLNSLKKLLDKYKNRQTKIASVTACSNVSGIQTCYHDVAKAMHAVGGLCFVDFACSAPYVEIDMHPADPLAKLDAIYFSPHKFLGGPGTPGVLIFDSKLYKNRVPDHPGGGTVTWTNPWGEHQYFDDIEVREDGGTPAFLQTIKAALCVKLKEQMGVKNILHREEELVKILFAELRNIDGLHILAENIEERLGVISFYIDGLHYNLGVKLLNDRFGIQLRGGCSCAGTYGHYLLNIDPEVSHKITDKIDQGDYSAKPGWIRLSIHPLMTDDEIKDVTNGIKELAENHKTWAKDYTYDSCINEFTHLNKDSARFEEQIVNAWFE